MFVNTDLTEIFCLDICRGQDMIVSRRLKYVVRIFINV